MLLQAAGAIARTAWPRRRRCQSAIRRCLLSESQQSIGGPPPLMEKLTPREREIVLQAGPPQGAQSRPDPVQSGRQHDGIYLIESGRIRVFYTSPLGREITLAYWRAGQFCRRPGGVRRRHPSMVRHRVQQRQRRASSRQGIARARDRDPESRDWPDRRADLQGQMLLRFGADAGNAFDHPAAGASAAASDRISMASRTPTACVIAAAFTHADLAHMVGADPAMGHHQPEADAGKADRANKRSQIVVCRPDVLEEMRGQASD